MDGLRAVGSELIHDPDKKLARIIEMAGIKKNNDVNRNTNTSVRTKKTDETVLHTATASNGVTYGIVQEGKHVYLKEAKNGYFEYIGGIQNLREHSYKTYADALKHLNFLFKDINMITETKQGTNILGEGYKLKIGAKEPAPAEPNFDQTEPDNNFDLDTDQGEAPAGGEDFNFGDDTEQNTEPQGAMAPEGEEDAVKKIQKLAGKLAQEIRDAKEGDVDDKIAKSVTNTVLSATLGFLTDEDKMSISNKLEDGDAGDEASGDEEFGGEDFGAESNPEPSNEPADSEDLKLEGPEVEEHNEPFDPSPMSKPGDHEVRLGESDVEEHNEPADPSPMSKPGDHEVHLGEAENEAQDPYSLFETALNAIMEKAVKLNDLKTMKNYIAETWGKMETAYNSRKYESMGRLAESLADMEEHNEPADPSPMSKPGDHEVHLEEHNEPNDPSPMSKPGDHEVKKETALENPNQILDPSNNGISGMVVNPATAFLQKNLKEGEEKVCEKCGKKTCECSVTEEKVHHKHEAGMVEEEKVHHKHEAGMKTVNEESIDEKWDKDVEIKSTGEHANKTIEQLQSELEALKEKSKGYQDQNKPVPESIKKQEHELNFAIRAKRNWKNEEEEKNLNEALDFLRGKINEIKSRLND